MSLSPGDKLGPYEILAPIGAGGMGEVYKARDPRLGRLVAIKTLKIAFDPRFKREAHAVAALNHPHICTLYDVGQNYLIMEYVEGAGLKGPLPVGRDVELACQILDALDAAHRKGITHRDLKPANVMVTKAGIKVLDFGLAKIAEPELASDETTGAALTKDNSILGTLHYMAPEQLQGKQDVDSRADIFAFGCVLYEMLTGKRAFDGSNAASLIAAVMERPAPSVAEIAPAALDRVLKKCLAKDPDDRWQNARDLKWNLIRAIESPAETPRGTRPASRVWPLIAAIAILAAAAVSFIHFREKPPDTALPMQFQIGPPAKARFENQMSLSPDGRLLSFTLTGADGAGLIWVRPLNSLEARPLGGTQNNGQPYFWSPDSRFIAYASTTRKLMKVDVSSGVVQTLCDAPKGVVGGAWNRDGVILFGTANGAGLMRVSEAGGVATEFTSLDPARAERSHNFPVFLPDGRHFIYRRASLQDATDGIYVGSLDGKQDHNRDKLLVRTILNSAYAPSHDSRTGFLLFMRDATLMAQRFDTGPLELSGEPVPVAQGIATSIGHGMFSVSMNGILAFRTGSLGDPYRLAWFDRAGNEIASVGQPGDYRSLAVSPDGMRVAVSRVERVQNLWVADLSRNTMARLTSGSGADTASVWSPDGSRIAFRSSEDNRLGIYRKLSSGTGPDEMLAPLTEQNDAPWDWSRDGRFLLFTRTGEKTRSDLWLMEMEGGHRQSPLLETEFNEGQAKFSPDGRWIAYASGESGISEVYVRPFVGSAGLGDGKIKVSEGGGSYPEWRGDGKELFYLGGTGNGPGAQELMSVEVSTTPRFTAGNARPLFARPLRLPWQARTWDVSADGKRFLVITAQSSGAEAPITVVSDWQAGLLKK